MALISLAKGAKYEIFAFGEGSKKADVITFIEDLNDQDFTKLAALLVRCAEHGVPVNKEKCRLLEDGIFEFKSGNVRLAWFYDTGRIIIAVHGFKKKRQKTDRKDIVKAQKLKAEYFEEKAKLQRKG